MKNKAMTLGAFLTLTFGLSAAVGDFTAEFDNVDSFGHAKSARLSFSRGAFRVLYIGYGSTDGGDDLMSWEKRRMIGHIHPGETTYTCDLPFDEDGGLYRYARFFFLEDELGLDTPRYEYLQFNGNACVSTGRVLSPTSTVEMACALTAVDETSCVFCARNHGAFRSKTLFYLNDGKFRYDYGNAQGDGMSFDVTESGGLDIVADAGNLSINGQVLCDKPTVEFENTSFAMLLFAANEGGGDPKYFTKGRVYSFRLWDGDRKLLMDLVPTSTNGVACFYDRIGRSYLGHKGSGSLVCGPVKTTVAVTERSNTLEGDLGSGRSFEVLEIVRDDERMKLVSARLSVSPGPRRWLYAVCGGADTNDNLDNWDEVAEVAKIEASEEPLEMSVLFPTGWRGDRAFARLFLADKDYVRGIDRRAYVVANGTQYVRTGFTPDQNSRTDFDVQFSTVDEHQTLFCARGTDTMLNTFTLFYVANAGWRYDFNRWQHASTATAVADTRYRVRTGMYNLDIDSVEVFPAAESSAFTAGSDLTLFASHTGQSGYGNGFKGRLYSFRAWSNATESASLALDLVPCVKDGVASLYNRVDGRYLAADVGQLVAGPSTATHVLWSSERMKLQRHGLAIIIR